MDGCSWQSEQEGEHFPFFRLESEVGQCRRGHGRHGKRDAGGGFQGQSVSAEPGKEGRASQSGKVFQGLPDRGGATHSVRVEARRVFGCGPDILGGIVHCEQPRLPTRLVVAPALPVFHHPPDLACAAQPAGSDRQRGHQAGSGRGAAYAACHGGVHRLVARPGIGQGDGQVLQQPDQAGLTGRMLPGGIAYVRWTQFEIDGTYDIRAKVKAVLDKALAAGAKAWLFDLRGNSGGNGADIMASWFMKGESVMRAQQRAGQPTVYSANADLRLPDAYQLPVAVILNDRSASDPEVFALYLKEAGRGTVVGAKSFGCVGSKHVASLPDGTQLHVTVEEFGRAISGAHYNNVGIPPDDAASDARAIVIAADRLRHARE